jgi:hypothetical protein
MVDGADAGSIDSDQWGLVSSEDLNTSPTRDDKDSVARMKKIQVLDYATLYPKIMTSSGLAQGTGAQTYSITEMGEDSIITSKYVEWGRQAELKLKNAATAESKTHQKSKEYGPKDPSNDACAPPDGRLGVRECPHPHCKSFLCPMIHRGVPGEDLFCYICCETGHTHEDSKIHPGPRCVGCAELNATGAASPPYPTNHRMSQCPRANVEWFTTLCNRGVSCPEKDDLCSHRAHSTRSSVIVCTFCKVPGHAIEWCRSSFLEMCKLCSQRHSRASSCINPALCERATFSQFQINGNGISFAGEVTGFNQFWFYPRYFRHTK